MQRCAGAAILVWLASSLAAPPAKAEGMQALGFNCWVGDGPSLLDCQALANELPPPTVGGLRRRLEGTPSCQLQGLQVGDRVQRTVEFRPGQQPLGEDAITAPYERAAGWRGPPEPQTLARYYPERAARNNTAGGAIVACDVDAEGLAERCRVVREQPAGYGFGEAVLKLAQDLRLSPAMAGCREEAAENVELPVHFQPPFVTPAAETPAIPYEEPRANWSAWTDILLIVANLSLAAVSWRRLRRNQAAPAPKLVEEARRAWPWRPLLGLVAGVGVSVWPAWLLWRAYGPEGETVRASPPPPGSAPVFVMLPILALIGCLLIVNLSLRADNHEREAHWIEDSSRHQGRGGLMAAFIEWSFFGLGWVFSGAHYRLGGRHLPVVVALAQISALTAAGMLCIALGLSVFG